ncbi:MAG TPA: TVP38/TMEM64 family protein [Oligoflexus sp.]|uniref:TVP38/TMEM64 family protein n=1 Tax=Oligoflexus sp. TaxID=1971216 RepID=UPI002D7F13F5|nr:TVP38/TMEM64 family protein [Oligoflexus sp.]HET9238718.1 TVP38/TMEM64 family protein [Oligoflexus sp.]
MRIGWQKLLLVLILLLFFTAFIHYDLGRFLTIAQLKIAKHELLDYYASHRVMTALLFVVTYIVLAALSVPGALSLTFAAGAIFGPLLGTVLASVGSALGATGAFLSARYLLGNSIQKRYAGKLEMINRGFRDEGAFYLVSLRLFAVIPYFVTNVVMGLTPIPTRTFLWATQLGMLPVIFLFTYTGTELSGIESVSDLFSPRLILSFIAMALLPIVAKKLIQWWKKHQGARKS